MGRRQLSQTGCILYAKPDDAKGPGNLTPVNCQENQTQHGAIKSGCVFPLSLRFPQTPLNVLSLQSRFQTIAFPSFPHSGPLYSLLIPLSFF